MDLVVGILIFVILMGIGIRSALRSARARPNSPNYYDDDLSDACAESDEDDLDDDEIDYWVSRGWSAGDGPPPIL